MAFQDGESLAIFEDDLKRNLYKIWNRMSSGSYFPPPVRLVEIPKGDGKLRPLGIPTVADRMAQTVAKMVLEPLLEPVFHLDSYGYRPNKFDFLGYTFRPRTSWVQGRRPFVGFLPAIGDKAAKQIKETVRDWRRRAWEPR